MKKGRFRVESLKFESLKLESLKFESSKFKVQLIVLNFALKFWIQKIIFKRFKLSLALSNFQTLNFKLIYFLSSSSIRIA